MKPRWYGQWMAVIAMSMAIWWVNNVLLTHCQSPDCSLSVHKFIMPGSANSFGSHRSMEAKNGRAEWEWLEYRKDGESQWAWWLGVLAPVSTVSRDARWNLGGRGHSLAVEWWLQVHRSQWWRGGSCIWRPLLSIFSLHRRQHYLGKWWSRACHRRKL